MTVASRAGALAVLAVVVPLLALTITAHRAGGVVRPVAGVPATPVAVRPAAAVPTSPTAPAAPTRVRARAPRAGDRPVQVPVPDPGWVARTATATGIDPVAVTAYGVATLRAAAEDAGCHLGWTTLAAIGQIESGHGTTGGRRLTADGTPSSPILGPALDGRSFAAIPATARSRAWHGDPHWDHAVGPLQFIPTTWDRWGSDGDGDGRSDPHDLDDASYAAARYLCAAGGDLATARGWTDAVFAYNHSASYVASLRSWANAYAR